MSGTPDPVDRLLARTAPPLIHIGYPKALSTWLQRHLFNRQDMGFYTLMRPMQCMKRLINIPPLEFDRSTLYLLFGRHQTWQPWMDNCVPVITGENLSGAPMAGGYDALTIAERLQACFPQGRILIIVREQKRMLRSLYSSFVTTGGLPHSLPRLLETTPAEPCPGFCLSWLRYDALVRGYQQLFGQQNVLVLPMEMFIEDPALFVRKILLHARPPTSLGQPGELPFYKKSNRSHKLSTLHLLSWWNRFFVRTTVNPRGLLHYNKSGRRWTRGQTAQQLDRLIPHTPVEGMLERRFMRISRARTDNAFADSNQRLQQIAGLDLARYGYDLP